MARDNGNDTDGEGSGANPESPSEEVTAADGPEASPRQDEAGTEASDDERSGVGNMVDTGQTGSGDPDTGTAERTGEDTAAQSGDTEGTANADGQPSTVEVTRGDNAALAAIVSFFIPGVGNMINGDTDRGVTILLLYIAWTVLAWGIGFFLIGTAITVLTLGIGAIIQILIGLVLAPIDLAIHVLAAVDAYQRSEFVDKVTVKVDKLR